jgi:hypothetical protein
VIGQAGEDGLGRLEARHVGASHISQLPAANAANARAIRPADISRSGPTPAGRSPYSPVASSRRLARTSGGALAVTRSTSPGTHIGDNSPIARVCAGPLTSPSRPLRGRCRVRFRMTTTNALACALPSRPGHSGPSSVLVYVAVSAWQSARRWGAAS